MSFIQEHAPCYVYEQKEIIEACRTLKSELEGFSFLYSIKTNPFDPIVKTAAAEGFGADAASVNEVKKSLANGMAKEDIYFSAPGRTEADILETWGKCVFIADSFTELKRVQKIAAEKNETVEIGLRVHPLFVMGSGTRGSSKFGVDLEDMDALKSVLAKCPNVKIIGMHVHLKSQLLDADALARYYRDVMDTAMKLQEDIHAEMKFINFGSGIGVIYDANKDKAVDLAKLKAETRKLTEENKTGLNAKLIIESGRFVICHAGKYYLPIVDKKISQGITYLICPNGMNGFMRPAIASLVLKVADGREIAGMEPLFTTAEEFGIRVVNDCEEKETVSVVGNLCTAMDVIKNNVTLNKAEIGDLIEITNAGSYAYSLSPLTFASQPLPQQYLHTKDDQWID